jgi:hypothetical protein
LSRKQWLLQQLDKQNYLLKTTLLVYESPEVVRREKLSRLGIIHSGFSTDPPGVGRTGKSISYAVVGAPLMGGAGSGFSTDPPVGGRGGNSIS